MCAAGQYLRRTRTQGHELGDVRRSLRPGAKTRCRVQMPDFANVVEAAAPRVCELGDASDLPERIVAATYDDARETATACAEPAASRREAAR